MDLLSLFKPKRNYLELLVSELKEDKLRLLKEVEELKEQLQEVKEFKINENIKEVHKVLTPLEEKIVKAYEDNKPNTLKELAKLSNVKVNSLSVYLSKIRTKGFKIDFR